MPSVCVLGLACCGVEAAAAPEASQTGDVASDDAVLVVAGTVTTKLAGRLRASYEATARAAQPSRLRVVAFGACAISGGPYWDSYSVLPGAAEVVPVDLCVPGCPPRPEDLSAALAALAAGGSDGG